MWLLRQTVKEFLMAHLGISLIYVSPQLFPRKAAAFLKANIPFMEIEIRDFLSFLWCLFCALCVTLRACSSVTPSPVCSAACTCNPVGSVLSADGHLCDPSNGKCSCKPGVGGPRCDKCSVGHWGLHEHGCRPCDCPGDCDPYTGDCSSG